MLRGFHLFMCIALTGDCRPTGNERCTVHHPFWVASGRELTDRPRPANLLENESEGLSLEGRWVDSHDLRAGDVLISRDGTPRTILGVEQSYESDFEVRNLTVQEFPSYAVGTDEVLVHNLSAREIYDKLQTLPRGRSEYARLARSDEHVRELFDEFVDGHKLADLSSKKGTILRAVPGDGTEIVYRSFSRTGGATVEVLGRDDLGEPVKIGLIHVTQ